jgi:arginase family enzyme
MIPSRVALLGVCYDGSSSYLRGTAGAPQVIREALRSKASNPWTELGVDLSAAALDDEATWRRLPTRMQRRSGAPSRQR